MLSTAISSTLPDSACTRSQLPRGNVRDIAFTRSINPVPPTVPVGATGILECTTVKVPDTFPVPSNRVSLFRLPDWLREQARHSERSSPPNQLCHLSRVKWLHCSTPQCAISPHRPATRNGTERGDPGLGALGEYARVGLAESVQLVFGASLLPVAVYSVLARPKKRLGA